MVQAGRDPDCLFCKIIDKQIPAKLVAEGSHFAAIRDINPQAPTHILIMPKEHVANISELTDVQGLGQLFQAVQQVARAENLDGGFRLVVNTGAESGQTVFHLHIHLLAGRAMRWPPG